MTKQTCGTSLATPLQKSRAVSVIALAPQCDTKISTMPTTLENLSRTQPIQFWCGVRRSFWVAPVCHALSLVGAWLLFGAQRDWLFLFLLFACLTGGLLVSFIVTTLSGVALARWMNKRGALKPRFVRWGSAGIGAAVYALCAGVELSSLPQLIVGSILGAITGQVFCRASGLCLNDVDRFLATSIIRRGVIAIGALLILSLPTTAWFIKNRLQQDVVHEDPLTGLANEYAHGRLSANLMYRGRRVLIRGLVHEPISPRALALGDSPDEPDIEATMSKMYSGPIPTNRDEVELLCRAGDVENKLLQVSDCLILRNISEQRRRESELPTE
jgi:hypothetical protein